MPKKIQSKDFKSMYAKLSDSQKALVTLYLQFVQVLSMPGNQVVCDTCAMYMQESAALHAASSNGSNRSIATVSTKEASAAQQVSAPGASKGCGSEK